ncbi:hypothetical protein AC578_1738 [Pseudocercospora eumusae]|uniref:Uncharacterized protein n=1 Tax=Pseudocercospora eumusae TaxID=321146 RepID=A0A139H064_9PEZI|nr:hypothetical protein AC578_1738 [Pseudocercospora eumusae]
MERGHGLAPLPTIPTEWEPASICRVAWWNIEDFEAMGLRPMQEDLILTAQYPTYTSVRVLHPKAGGQLTSDEAGNAKEGFRILHRSCQRHHWTSPDKQTRRAFWAAVTPEDDVGQHMLKAAEVAKHKRAESLIPPQVPPKDDGYQPNLPLPFKMSPPTRRNVRRGEVVIRKAVPVHSVHGSVSDIDEPAASVPEAGSSSTPRRPMVDSFLMDATPPNSRPASPVASPPATSKTWSLASKNVWDVSYWDEQSQKWRCR